MNNRVILLAAIMIGGVVALDVQAGKGGAVAGGLLGGYVLGSAIANSNRPAEVVYVNNYGCNRNMFRRLEYLENKCRNSCRKSEHRELNALKDQCG